MKTTEEIYNDNGCNSKREIIEAMNEYAKQFKPQWIPVSERLPEDNRHHLVLINGDRNSSYHIYLTGGYDDIYKQWLTPFGHNIGGNITHWMPLAEPPII